MRLALTGCTWHLQIRFGRALAAACLSLLVLAATAAEVLAGQYAAIIVDAETGAVLHEANADARAYPASLTKMMTLYLLFEALDKGVVSRDQNLPVSKRAAGQPATNLGLRPGDAITVDLAIRALTIRSANDVATVVAEALAGSESAFAKRMTAKARQLGMTKTTFRNASGLPDKGQTTTARDLAVLALALMRDFPQHYGYFSARSFAHKGRTYTTHNRLMLSYSGADGLKTGYIRASGFNLATSAVRDGRRLVGIVLGGKTAHSRDTHMASLLDRGFATLGAGKETLTVAGGRPAVVLAPTTPLAMPAPKPSILAALVPSAEAAPAVPPEAEPMAGPWGVQVGAFGRFEPAQRAAAQAARLGGKLLSNARVIVDERAKNNRTLYRARIVGLTEKDARAACKLLERKKTPCLVVRLDLTVALSQAQ